MALAIVGSPIVVAATALLAVIVFQTSTAQGKPPICSNG
jgi:hypothetical protein